MLFGAFFALKVKYISESRAVNFRYTYYLKWDNRINK